jgi:hypothetical protein
MPGELAHELHKRVLRLRRGGAPGARASRGARPSPLSRVVDQILRLVRRLGGIPLGAARIRGERALHQPRISHRENRLGPPRKRSSPPCSLYVSVRHRYNPTNLAGRPRRSTPAPLCPELVKALRARASPAEAPRLAHVPGAGSHTPPTRFSVRTLYRPPPTAEPCSTTSPSGSSGSAAKRPKQARHPAARRPARPLPDHLRRTTTFTGRWRDAAFAPRRIISG